MKLEETQKKALSNALKGIDGEAYLFEGDKNDVSMLIYSEGDPLMISKEVAQNYFLYCEKQLDVVVMNPKNMSDEQKAFIRKVDLEKL
jgi:hypothetical protein